MSAQWRLLSCIFMGQMMLALDIFGHQCPISAFFHSFFQPTLTGWLLCAHCKHWWGCLAYHYLIPMSSSPALLEFRTPSLDLITLLLPVRPLRCHSTVFKAQIWLWHSQYKITYRLLSVPGVLPKPSTLCFSYTIHLFAQPARHLHASGTSTYCSSHSEWCLLLSSWKIPLSVYKAFQGPAMDLNAPSYSSPHTPVRIASLTLSPTMLRLWARALPS